MTDMITAQRQQLMEEEGGEQADQMRSEIEVLAGKLKAHRVRNKELEGMLLDSEAKRLEQGESYE